MEAPEINKLIHEWMGKCWSDDYEWRPTKHSLGARYTACKSCGRDSDDHSQPDYCQDLNATMEAVDVMRKRFLEIEATETTFFRFDDCCEHGWNAATLWGHHDGDIPIHHVADKSLPMAIAKLLVIEIQGLGQ